MIRLFTDFQAVDPQDMLYILKLDGIDLSEIAENIGVNVGDRVILDAHEDFEIIGMLDFKYVDILGKEAWVAVADWSTRRDKPISSN